MDVVLGLLIVAAQERPEPEDVKAGWVAFGIFLLLAAAVVVLGFSLTKQLRRAERAEEAGLYGGGTDGADADDTPAEPGSEAPGEGEAPGTGGRTPSS